MTKARVELLGGPDCGRTDSLSLPAGGHLPDTLAARDGRDRYLRTSERAQGRLAYSLTPGRLIYAWQPERPAALLRATCEQHRPARPGCPGYRAPVDGRGTG